MLIRISLLLMAACGNATPTSQTVTPTPTTEGVATTPTTPTASVLRATDVTIVWPLPADEAQRDSMLAATSMGGHGELLPANLYDVPLLDERDSSVTDPKRDRERLRVVAARYEPCRGSFGSPSDATCVNQIRLVLQVFRPGGGGARNTMGANDGAVLAFYKITRDEVLTLARDMAAIGDGDADALGVHPGLAREGVGSAYAKALQDKILKLVGAKRLTKVTFFARTQAREPLWPFGTFTVVDGKLVKGKIPTLAVDHQSLEGTFRKVIEPSTSAADKPGVLLTVFGAARAASEAERAAYASVLRIQNPTKHNADTMSCAECHAAQQMQQAAEKTLGLRAADYAADAYAPKVKATSGKIDAENFHLVGYLGTNLAIGTRTVHDTDAVREALRSLMTPKP